VTNQPLVAITGGSGFIGSHVIDALRDAGYAVRVLDPREPLRKDVDWVPTDIMDLAGLTEAVRGTEATFHLAAMADVNDVFARPADSVALNIQGTANVLEATRIAEAGKVVLASTVWVYAASDPELADVDEDTQFDPNTDRHLYVTTKVAAEMMCRDYRHLYGRPYTVLRYGIPFGPRMRDNIVSAAFFLRALRGETIRIDGDGRQQRFFVFVKDLARAHVLALEPQAENETFNIEGSVPISIRQIAETVQQLVGNTVVEFGPSRPGDLAARVVHAEKARDVLGWEPEVSFEEGMKITFEWYLQRLGLTRDDQLADEDGGR